MYVCMYVYMYAYIIYKYLIIYIFIKYIINFTYNLYAISLSLMRKLYVCCDDVKMFQIPLNLRHDLV